MWVASFSDVLRFNLSFSDGEARVWRRINKPFADCFYFLRGTGLVTGALWAGWDLLGS